VCWQANTHSQLQAAKLAAQEGAAGARREVADAAAAAERALTVAKAAAAQELQAAQVIFYFRFHASQLPAVGILPKALQN